MRYRLRTLLIALALGPPAIWFAFGTVAIIAEAMRPTAVTTLRGIEYDSLWDLPYPDDVPASATNGFEEEPPMFRFTIRDVLWLTVLAAVLVTWWIDRSRLAKLRDRSDEAARQLFSLLPSTGDHILLRDGSECPCSLH